MIDKNYISEIKYGKLLFWIPLSFPLILWSFFIYNFLDLRKMSIKFIKTRTFELFFLLLMSVTPYLYVLYTFYLKKYNYADEIFPWASCLSLNMPQHLKEKGVIGSYDYKCEGVQSKLIHFNIKSLIDRGYYINYGLFLIIIMIYNNTKKEIFDDEILANWSLICIFLGLLGSTLVAFDDFLFISIMFLKMGTTNLIMLNSSFGIVLSRLIHVLFK
jgi:hypothetical protein|tara:strand:- start:394 stop:1041 length:648 start_codon:yes stop_codon:yes gene_type:complete